MLLILLLCVIFSVGFSSNVHTVLPENHDSKPVDGDEYGVRNYMSDHELPRDVPTRVKIVGDLGTPPPSVTLDFVPKQTYVQVRRYDAVKRLPQDAAVEESATSEEAENAPRLREVVTHKKTQEVYEEQGYEDAGYDHGGSKKIKVEEEIKDSHSKEVFKPKNSSAQNIEETRDHIASVAPSSQGTWGRHKTTSGKETRYEEDGGKRKVSTSDSNPINEKSFGSFTKFDGGKTIIVQNLTQSVKKDSKNEGAESRRVPSISKTKDNVEPTTYRPIMRYNNSRNKTKQVQNEQKINRTRNRNRLRKRPEVDAQKLQISDVIGSYDNSPWIPIQTPVDYNTSLRERPEIKKQIKSKINSEIHESNGHATRFGYTVNHNSPYQYVFPTDVLAPELSNKPKRKLRPKSGNSHITDGKLKRPSNENFGFITQTNYDGSAINSKQEKIKKSSGEDESKDNTHLLINEYKKPKAQLKINSTHNINHDEGVNNKRQRNKSAHFALLEHSNRNLMAEPSNEQTKTGLIDIKTDEKNLKNSQYIGTLAQDFGPPKTYDAPFITKLKKNNFNSDSRGDPTLHVYSRYQHYPNLQNVKLPITEEMYYVQKPLSENNNGYTNIELNDSPKSENIRFPDYSKIVNNNRPKNIYKHSGEPFKMWENYHKINGQSTQLSENTKFNKVDGYPKFETNKRIENTGTTKSPVYRLTPYEKSVKINNPYSYVYHDDHYPSGSRYSGIKVEVTTQSPKLNNGIIYWNNRHPHLPKDSIKNTSGMNYRGQVKSEDENTRHVENLTLAHFSGFHKSGSYRPLPLEYNERVNNLAKLLNDNYPRRIRRDLEVLNIASSGTTTEIPIDTLLYPHYKRAPKESALRYATNPILTPRKTAGGMEFYASTKNIQCNEDIKISELVPERINDGEWKGEPSIKSPKVDALGDKIGCFKTKYFGSDPLDNPIFKEKDIGFPDVIFSTKKQSEIKEDLIQPGKPHVDWNFSDELIPNSWFPDSDKRSRRSNNNSFPINHAIQGMSSTMTKPVFLSFPIKSSVNVNNNTKYNIGDNDSEVSIINQHVVKYSVQHPTPKYESIIKSNDIINNKIIGLIPPPPNVITTKIYKNHQKLKKPTRKKLLKKAKISDDSNEPDILDVLSPITAFFIEEDDKTDPPVVHNFFNIKMIPSEKLKTSIIIDKNSSEKLNIFNMQNFKRNKRNMIGIDLQKPKQRKININSNTNVTISPSTAKVRMHTPKNGTWFREKNDYVSVNVDVRRKEPRYYYHTEQPKIRVKRVVHSPPLYNRSSQLFSSKYLIVDQENSETLPEEINVAFSTTPKYESTPKFIPAIAFGDSKTKIINYNDSIANSTNDVEHPQFDKKGSLIYVINPDTGLGKWMQVIKVKNEEDAKSAFSNGPVYIEKKVKDGIAEESIGKFGFKGSTKDLFRNVLNPTVDHRFKTILPTKDLMKVTKEFPKKPNCPIIIRPKKQEIRRRSTTTTTTTTTTTEIPVVEEIIDDRPEEQSGEEENTAPQGDEDEGVNEEEQIDERPEEQPEEQPDEQLDEQPVEQPQYQQESEENPDNTEGDDQDIHESKRKLPRVVDKKPEFKGYYFGSKDKNRIII